MTLVFTNVTGNERRNIIDIRTSGAVKGFDWDVEGMNQSGSIGRADHPGRGTRFISRLHARRRAVETSHGALAVDVATGDHNPSDNRLETFNPLFPNGYYLADYTGFSKLDPRQAGLDRPPGARGESDRRRRRTMA